MWNVRSQVHSLADDDLRLPIVQCPVLPPLDGIAIVSQSNVVTGIVLDNIGFWRNNQPVLQQVALSVNPGEYLTLAGPSGSGKTTVLRLIAGLEKPRTGKMGFLGKTSQPVERPRIALVFQGGALYPHLNVRENLEFGQTIRGVEVSERRRHSDDIARKLGIGDWMKRLPEELSGGEAQRVAMGRALLQNPEILLLDEPLANLDGPMRRRLRMEVLQWHKEFGLTTVHVTHDQEEAMALGDRVALLHEGRIQQLGRPEQVYHKPTNRWVAGFLGSPPMNFTSGKLEPTTEGRAFVSRSEPEWRVDLPPDVLTDVPTGCRGEMGFRPESVGIGPSRGESAGTDVVEGVLERVEFTGANLWWQVRIGADRWTVRGKANVEARPGSRWQVRIDWSAAHWFELASNH